LQVVLEQNLVLPEILLHPNRHHGFQLVVPPTVVQPPQRTPKYQTVKACHHSHNLVVIFLDKLLHGVLLVSLNWNLNDMIVQKENASLWSTPVCGEAALCSDRCRRPLALVGLLFGAAVGGWGGAAAGNAIDARWKHVCLTCGCTWKELDYK
jgi:hypothetical protein